MTERDFQRRVVELARLAGWRLYHHRPARVGHRVVTALEGDPGFPDLILLRPPRLVIAELKVGRNRPTPAQQVWLEQLAGAGVESYLWRPEDWDSVVACLLRREPSHQLAEAVGR